MENYEILWKTALPEVENTVSNITFDTYVSRLIPVDIVDDKLVLIIEDNTSAEFITDHLREKIRNALIATNSCLTDISVVVAGSKEEYAKSLGVQETKEIENSGSPVNPKLTFDSFVVGTSNEFIFAAAKAVAENPGESYNPLYIYGGTGLGKTHILMAIANYIKLHNPSLNVLYATCEQFTNQMIESISKGRVSPTDFRNKYRNVDVLLIDDVQFLAKKQGVQMEFFHTFNELVMQNKQIVLTSDCPPKDIELLEERLRSRFEGGLIADVQTPDLETKVAILKKKSEEQKCLIDIKVLTYIAENSDGNVRTLVGKLIKVIFASKLREVPITVELVNEALKESIADKEEELQVEDIINCVCNFYKVNKADVLGKKKNHDFVEPRQICIYLINDMMSLPLETIGQKMGGRDHATVIYARDKIEDLIKMDNKLNKCINDIKAMLLKK